MAVNANGQNLSFQAQIDLTQMRADIAQVHLLIAGMSNNVQREAAAIDGLTRRATRAFSGFLQVAGVGAFVNQMVQIRGQFQQLEVAFTTMLRSKPEADKLMAQMVELAAKTPFSLMEVADGAKQLLAYGTQVGEVTKTIEMLGNVSSGVSQPLSSIVYLYGTLRTQGRAMTKDIREFTGRGIPMIAELAKVLGVAEKEVGDLVTAGKVGFPEVERAFQAMTGAGGMFEDLMREQSKTLTGQISNLGDAVDIMFNEMGKSQQGLFSTALSGATYMVENYEQITKILAALIATYGIYRAALALTAAITAANTAATIAAAAASGVSATAVQALTASQVLQYYWTGMVEKAQKLLNLTMLANPYVAVGAALAGLAGYLILTRDRALEARDATQLLSDAKEGLKDRSVTASATLDEYAKALERGNLTESQRLELYDKIRKIDPVLLAGMKDKSIAIELLRANITKYVSSLKGLFEAEANEMGFEKGKARESDLEKQVLKYIGLMNKANDSMRQGGAGASGWAIAYVGYKKELEQAQGLLKDQQATNAKLAQGFTKTAAAGKTEPATRYNKSYYTKEKERIQGEIDDLDKTAAGFVATRDKLIAQRQKVEQQLAAFSPEKAERKGLNPAKEYAKQKLDILKSLNDEEHRLRLSGLSRLDSDLEAAANKYEDMRRKMRDFNKTAPAGQQFGAGSFQRIDAAEQTETGTIRYRDDTDKLKESLDKQEQLYADYEQFRADFGDSSARKRYQGELDLSKTFFDKLRQEYAKTFLSPTFSAAGQDRVKMLAERLAKEADLKEKSDNEAAIAALDRSHTLQNELIALEEQYLKDVVQLQNNSSLTETDRAERLVILEQRKNDSVKSANETAFLESAVYRNLLEGMANESLTEIRRRIAEVREALGDADLTPAQKAELQTALKSMENTAKSGGRVDENGEKTKNFAEQMGELAEVTGASASAFYELAGALASTDEGLSSTLETMGDLSAVATSAATAAMGFATGNPVQIIQGVTGVISGLINIGAKARESERKANEELAAFRLKAWQGELEFNKLLRERKLLKLQDLALSKANLQIRLQELTAAKAEAEAAAKGITAKLIGTADPSVRARADALKKKGLGGQLQAAAMLRGIGGERYITGQHTEKYGGFLGMGKKTRTVNDYATLAGKSYEELEKLYAEGRLEGNAKNLFEELQKLTEEGKSFAEELKKVEEQIKELNTGTTMQGLSDSFMQAITGPMQDSGKVFEDVLRKAILNGIQYGPLQKQMEAFYEKLASNTADPLTEKEVADLQAKWDAMVKDQRDQLAAMEKITGIKLLDDEDAAVKQNTLAGAIKGMSEEQASLLGGQLGGMRLAQLEGNQLQDRQLSTATIHLSIVQGCAQNLLKIEANTRKSADNSDHLKVIAGGIDSLNKKMDAGTAKAAGW